MNLDRMITATTPLHPGKTDTRSLREVRALIAKARGEDSADINAMLLDAGKPVTMTVRGNAITFTPEN